MRDKYSLQRLISILGSVSLAVVASLAIASTAVAQQPCDPEEAKWAPDQHYTKDMVVHHKEHWYQARELNNGKEPGITFEWEELDQTPDCGQPSLPGNTAERSSAKSGSTLCVRPEHWRFSHGYSTGALVTHGGKVWKATSSTSGDMPGMGEPPSWQLVPDHCSMKLD
ncbi:carbohydrate-binding protein [Marinobacter salinus]|uniref:carbohydrate-binding protein n=1 Tax=Marinobacter salinus TaxID=1874317 RepID=UPI000BFFBDD3|nr:carbohydrate-binding protein [Marinobacter salinus]